MLVLDIDGVKLAYEERGSGPPVLLIHGTGGNVWGELPEMLARERRAIFYDRRGFGGSTHEPIKDPPRHTADAAGLLEALDAAPAAVVGHSMGGVIALHLAVTRPELVRGLVLVEPPLHLKKHPNLPMMVALIGTQIVRRTRGERAAAERFFRWATRTTDGANGYDSTPAAVQAALLANSAAVVRELDAGTGEQMKPRDLAAISCPVVCLIGSVTLPDYRRAAERLVRTRPATEIVDVPGAGHVLPITHPSAVVDALRRVDAGAPVVAAGEDPPAAS
jgi:pimeloyl-ACP methyl ester carboxylesterase